MEGAFVKPLLLGHVQKGDRPRPVFVDAKERQTHMHVIGRSGAGKSKFLESLMRQDIKNRQGFCLIDPHGTLCDAVLNYCAHSVERNVIVLDLSEPSKIVGFNPFRRTQSGDVSVQIDQRIDATLRAWGKKNSDE